MNKKEKTKIILLFIITIVVFIAVTGFSWITTCGIIKLITMCFGWTFKWSIATGIWLVIYFIVQPIFSSLIGRNNNKEIDEIVDKFPETIKNKNYNFGENGIVIDELKEIKNILRWK